MTYTFNITPIGKPRMVNSDRWRERPEVMRYRAFKDELGYQVKKQKYVLEDTLTITFNIPMPVSWSESKRNLMNHQPHKGKPDIDNLLKAWMDALTIDDSHIWCVYALKYWSEEGSIFVQVD